MTVSKNILKYKRLFAKLPDRLQKEYQKEVKKEIKKNINYLIQDYYLTTNPFSEEGVIPFGQIYHLQLKDNIFSIWLANRFLPGQSPLPIFGQDFLRERNEYLTWAIKLYFNAHQQPDSFMESYQKAIHTTVLELQQHSSRR